MRAEEESTCTTACLPHHLDVRPEDTEYAFDTLCRSPLLAHVNSRDTINNSQSSNSLLQSLYSLKVKSELQHYCNLELIQKAAVPKPCICYGSESLAAPIIVSNSEDTKSVFHSVARSVTNYLCTPWRKRF